MKKNLLAALLPLSIIIAGVLIGGVLLFSGSNDSTLEIDTAKANIRKVDLEIQNMFCIGCRSSVVNFVRTLPGVVQADADPGTNSGWVIYDSDIITKEQIIASSIFQAYPVKILADQSYEGIAKQKETEQIPPEIEQKLSLLALRLQNLGVTMEPFFQEELDDAIGRGYWDKANNLLDNYLQAYEYN